MTAEEWNELDEVRMDSLTIQEIKERFGHQLTEEQNRILENIINPLRSGADEKSDGI